MGGELVLAHMSQHLLLADIGALLIVLGLTGPLLQPLLGLRFLGRLRVLANPAVALPLWIADLYALARAGAVPGDSQPARRCTRSSTRASCSSG